MVKYIVIVAVIVVVCIVFFTTNSGESEHPVVNLLEEIKESVFDGERNFNEYGLELNEQFNTLPATIVDIRWEIKEESEDKCEIFFHWNADDDLQDVGLIHLKGENEDGDWSLKLLTH